MTIGESLLPVISDTVVRPTSVSTDEPRSLGKPPYNGGAFYGNADTGFQVTSTTDGEVWTQTGMEMPATSQTS